MCKGFCSRYRDKQPQLNAGLPYQTYSYCRRCSFWMKKDQTWGKNRCPCCHGIIATRPRESYKKRKYRMVENETPA